MQCMPLLVTIYSARPFSCRLARLATIPGSGGNGVVVIKPRPAGRGGGVDQPPRFFADILKTAARSANVFDTPYHTSILHML